MACRRSRFAALLLAVPLIVGCADGPEDTRGPNDGDCNARIGWDGAVYRSHNQLNQAAPRGARLGMGDVLDCYGTSVATVEVFAVDGVDSALAIKVIGEWRAVYVAEGTSKASWPEPLRTP